MARISTHTAPLIAIRIFETNPTLPVRSPPYVVRAWRVVRLPSATHDGQWKPTLASFMQSGQIGFPHRWQRM